MINSFLKLLFISMTVALFSGCVQNNPQTTQQNLPQWFINAPQNSGVYLYGSGEAATLQEAKNQALNDMAARLSVNVHSNITQNTQSFSNQQGAQSYSKSVNQNIDVTVEDMGFTNAKIVNSAMMGNSFFVLMQVNRSELFNNKKKEFDALHESIVKREQTAHTMPALEEIYALDKLQPDLEQGVKKAKILNAINNAFDDKPYIAQYQAIQTQATTQKQALKIAVETNLSEGFFAAHMIEALNKAQYKMASSNANVHIELNSSVNYSIAMGWHIAKVVTTIKVKSNQKVISTNTINSVGRSTSTQQNALIGASRAFKTKLNQLSVETILFNK